MTKAVVFWTNPSIFKTLPFTISCHNSFLSLYPFVFLYGYNWVPSLHFSIGQDLIIISFLVLINVYIKVFFFTLWFLPNRLTGPIWSSSCKVCLCVFCLSPSHAIFIKCWRQKGSNVEFGYLLILITSGEKSHHHLLLFSYHCLLI